MARPTAVVFGAYGYTGRFLVSELLERRWRVVPAGRDAEKLEAARFPYPASPWRQASVDDAGSLDRALAGADVVINTAGPFAFTAGPVIEASMRARIPYLDVAAELEAILDTFEKYGSQAKEAGVPVVPAMAFFGGLGDLLATAALGDRPRADEISIAYGLDSWKPTPGTRAAGSVSRTRRNGRRVVFAAGKLEYREAGPPSTTWAFSEPLGNQPVVGEFTMADTVTIAHHIEVPEIRSYMTSVALDDLAGERTEPPSPADARGRSAQTFLVDVVVRSGNAERRITASGRDMYAMSASLVAEAAERVIGQRPIGGVFSAGELFDARDFLDALSAAGLIVAYRAETTPRASVR